MVSMVNRLLLSMALAAMDLRNLSSVISRLICWIYAGISLLGMMNPLSSLVIISFNDAKLSKARGTQPHCCASINVSGHPSKGGGHHEYGSLSVIRLRISCALKEDTTQVVMSDKVFILAFHFPMTNNS